MWFKQASLFQFTRHIKLTQEQFSAALEPLVFTPCLPSLPASVGWISPLAQIDGPLVYGNKRFWAICFQFEEKILPTSVIRQALNEKVEEIEKKESRPVKSKEKLSLKDEITLNLLPKAFTKKSKVFAYFDWQNQWLIIDSNTPAKVERLISFLKRAVPDLDLKSPDVKKPTAVMTNWLKHPQSNGFDIGQSGVLQDPQQQRRVIRCQNQDLFAHSIQSLLKDGCEIAQLSLSWKDQINFVLTGEFTLRSIQFKEAVLNLSKADYTETPQQRFDADFMIMTELFTHLIADLMMEFGKVATGVEV